MKFSKSIFSAVLLLLLITVFHPSHGAATAVRKKCKAEALSGKWYGEMRSINSPTTFKTILHIASVKDCKITGTFYFPAYFNTKVKVEGEIKNNMLVMQDLNLVQGMEYSNKSTYEFPMPADQRLEGIVFSEGEKDGTFAAVHESALDEQTLALYQQEIKQSESTFGLTLISEEKVDLTSDELVERYKKSNNARRWEDIKTIDISGHVMASGMKFPMEMAIKSPNKMRMKFHFQNLSFEMGNNGKQSWEYNPMEDKLTVKDNEDTSKVNNGFDLSDDDLLDKMLEEYNFTAINHATVDGVNAYRIKLEKEEDWFVTYINKENWQVIREESSDLSLSLQSNHRKHDGLWYPGNIHEISLKQGFTAEKFSFSIETIQFNTAFENSYFDIPEKLKYKKVEVEKSSTYYNDLGNEQFEKGQYQEAEVNYTQSLKLDPNDAIVYQNRGRARAEMDKYYEGIADFNRAIELNPKHAPAYNYRGVAKYQLGDMKGAIPDFTKAITLDSTFAQAYSNRGFAYSNTNENEASLQDFQMAVRYDSTNAQYHFYNGQILKIMERYTESVQSFSKAIELGKNDANGFNWLGVAYSYTGDVESALENYLVAYELDNNNAQYVDNIAGAYYALENYAASIEYYTALLDMDTDKKDGIYYSLGLNYYAQEYYQEAKNYYDKAIELNAQNAVYFDNRALARQQLMDLTGAIEDYSVSISLYPKDPNVYYYRGLLKTEVQDQFSGCLDFKKAKELGHEEAAKLLKENCVLESEAKN